mgnify:FL=1
MCSLFGMAGPGIVGEDLQWLDDIMIVSCLRGIDSLGVLQGRFTKRHKRFDILRYDENPLSALEKSWVLRDGLFNGMQNNVFMGHTRSATIGDINENNIHPFKHGSIIGSHNGTIKSMKNSVGNGTDSDLLFSKISEHGYDYLSNLSDDDAYAITFVDSKTGDLNFVKNPARGLFICINKKRRVIYWASEEGFLSLTLTRIGINHTEISKFDNWTLFTVTPEKIKSLTEAQFTRTELSVLVEKEKEKEKKLKEKTRGKLIEIPGRTNANIQSDVWPGLLN